MVTLHRKLYRDLLKLKGQVITIALVVCSGISVLIASVSTYDSLSVAQSQFYHDYHFADVFATLKRAPDTYENKISEIPGVAQVETRIVKDVTIDLPSLPEPAIGRFISLPDKGSPRLNQLFLRKGNWLRSERVDEVLVNEGFAIANHLKVGDHVSAILNGHYEKLTIAGIVLSPEYVYAIRGEDLLPDNQHFGVFWMKRKAMSAAFGMQEAFNDICLSLAPNASLESVRAQLERYFLPYGLSITYPRREQISDRFVSNEIKQQKIIATVIPPIFLLVAAFLLNIVTGRLVYREREQIATLKAMGFENATIGFYYFKLVMLIVLLGAVMGLGLGAWFGSKMTLLYADYFRFPAFHYRFSLSSAFIGIVVSLIAAISGALRAVYQVVRLYPAVAMRPPTPAYYRALGFERLVIFKGLSASTKMFYRYVLRHLLRTSLTVIGIALAMAIIILGLFWRDAVAYLIKTQFMLSQREDAMVTLYQPAQANVLNELAHLTGVVAAEGYRVVPARITYQYRTEQVSLFGLPQNAKLKQLLDEHLNRINIPRHGLVMSSGLAERLHVKVGDLVEMNVLEGNRAQTRLRVQALVTDYVGMFAYTDNDLINDVLNEDRLINLAGMTVDANAKGELYREIKELPKVSSITFKSNIIDTFNDTFAKHILIFTSILTGFAMVIAVSVVYNNAIINLNERAWELATLRVIGFAEYEITTMLFYQMMLEVLVAVPIGALIGYFLSKMILQLMQTDWFSIPFVIEYKTYAIAMIVILLAGLTSFLIVKRRIAMLNLTAVLKVRD